MSSRVWRNNKYINNFGLDNLKEGNHLEDLGVDGRIGLIFKWILKDEVGVFGQSSSGLG
jgi:hypothetical protein